MQLGGLSVVETTSHVAQVILKLVMYWRMILNFSSFCLHFLNAGITLFATIPGS